MTILSRVFVVKIIVTVFVWCIPLLLFPCSLLEAMGFPDQQSYIFIRLLGLAYLSLCIGYCFGLLASFNGKRLMSSIWVGVVSNGGACLYLLYYGVIGTWTDWGFVFQAVAWGSALLTALITIGLYICGVLGDEPVVG